MGKNSTCVTNFKNKLKLEIWKKNSARKYRNRKITKQNSVNERINKINSREENIINKQDKTTD